MQARSLVLTSSVAASLLLSVSFNDSLAQSAGGAQGYPAKPVRLVVPFPPGSSTDIVSRLLAQKMSQAWNHQVIVDNRPGGGGAVGVELAARAPADGYTLVVGHIGTHGVNPSLFPKLPYDPIKDTVAITQTVSLPLILAVHPSVPVKTVKELSALARAKKGELNYASGGNGSAAHLAVEYYKLLAKVDMVHVPYKGTGPALTDLMAGNVSVTITGMPPLMPHIKSGKLKALAVTTAQRVEQVPNLPTFAESGYPEYEINSWQGFFAPAGTPSDIVSKIHGEIARTLKLPDVRDRLSGLGANPVASTPEQFVAHVKKEIAKWARVVKAAGIRVD
jgi:tripartite-type tricarboxylate transporter receptor subunit TctC